MPSEKNDGGPAFPHANWSDVQHSIECAVDLVCRGNTRECAVSKAGDMILRSVRHGMSLRNWFAGMALNGLVESGVCENHDPAHIADVCFLMADAMLAERDRERVLDETPEAADHQLAKAQSKQPCRTEEEIKQIVFDIIIEHGGIAESIHSVSARIAKALADRIPKPSWNG
jgi:Asp-tRNA(Asn)/Glu-tRNA(Gln) amidotransferase B subunit